MGVAFVIAQGDWRRHVYFLGPLDCTSHAGSTPIWVQPVVAGLMAAQLAGGES